MSNPNDDLNHFAGNMLAGFAQRLLRVPVGDLPDLLRSLAGTNGARHAPAPRASAPAAVSAAPAAARGGRKPARKKGAKRSSESLEQLTVSLKNFITEHPGSNMETIAKALSETSTDLALPIQKLLSGSSVRKEGNRRATRYYPADGAATSAPAAPRVRAAAKKKGPVGRRKKSAA